LLLTTESSEMWELWKLGLLYIFKKTTTYLTAFYVAKQPNDVKHLVVLEINVNQEKLVSYDKLCE
jgi:hypothetical protein